MRLAACLGLAALALAAALSPAASVAARHDTEHADLFVVGLRASHPVRITHTGGTYGFALDPTWSPDARRIAFSYGACDDCPGTIVIVDADGSHRRLLDNAVGARPAWSPDGRRIAFVTPGQAIATVDVASGRTSPLVAAGRYPVDYPAWSPDGSRLAFARRVTPENWDLFVTPLHGGRTLRLTNTPRAEFEPAWSRDGRRIAYVQQLPSLRYAVSIKGANGGGARTVTRQPGSAEAPTWSPDDRFLSFVALRRGEPDSLWVIGVDGRGARRLTDSRTQVISASWAPKGRQIVFAARDVGG